MTSDPPQLGRSLLGYRRAAVRQVLADRETMFRLVKDQAQRAEERVEEIREELETARAELRAQSETTDAMLAEAHAGLESANAALKSRGEHVELAEADLARSRKELETARKELETARKELDTARVEVADARAAVKSQTQRAETAAARTTRLETQLLEARQELALRSEPSPSKVLATDELSAILETAERGVTGILERTRRAYEDQFAEVQAERRTIQSEIDRFSEWRVQVEPRVHAIQQSIQTAGERIARVPGQIQSAVDTMAQAVAEVNASLKRLATLPEPISERSAGSDERADTPAVASSGRLIQLQDHERTTPTVIRTTTDRPTDGGEDDTEPESRSEPDDSTRVPDSPDEPAPWRFLKGRRP